MKNQLIKGLITGFIVGCFFSACDSNLLQAEGDDIINCDDLSYGDYGTVEWNPIYVKIVEQEVGTNECNEWNEKDKNQGQ